MFLIVDYYFGLRLNVITDLRKICQLHVVFIVISVLLFCVIVADEMKFQNLLISLS